MTENTVAAETEPSPWLTMSEAREKLGVTLRLLRLLVKRGELTQKPNIYDRRIKEIKRADVERVLRDGVEGMRPPRRKAAA